MNVDKRNMKKAHFFITMKNFQFLKFLKKKVGFLHLLILEKKISLVNPKES